MEEPPEPPRDTSFVGYVYNLAPDGATFDPSAALIITYDADLIPKGVWEGNLIIAQWDESVGQWANLASIVNAADDNIAAEISHFTAFAILAYTRPASFTTSDLVILPSEVEIGETTTITAVCTNTGDIASSHEAILKIDGIAVDTREVALDGGKSQQVSFDHSEGMAGTYHVSVNSLGGILSVKEPSGYVAESDFTTPIVTSSLTITPAEVEVEQGVTISAMVTNNTGQNLSADIILKINDMEIAAQELNLASHASQIVSFTVAMYPADTYMVDINGLPGTVVVKEKSQPSPFVPRFIPTSPSTQASSDLPSTSERSNIGVFIACGIFGGIVVCLLFLFLRKRMR
jgi:hypothetical protein